MDFEKQAKSIERILKEQVKTFHPSPQVYEYGVVKSSNDGVVVVTGLPNCRYGELLKFEHDTYGMAMELEKDKTKAILFSNSSDISIGTQVESTGRVVQVPVGDILLGRVFNPMGEPLDGEPFHATEFRAIEEPAPTIMQRQEVDRPLETGLLAIDSMVSIGRGQRELIIGDRQTGKTQIAIDTILNQKGKDVICIYCAIGQKTSTVKNILQVLTANEAMHYSIIVSATASDSAALQYIAPYAACAMAEYFMYQGRDVLVVYDDLSKHAVAYREISLLLKRPPGREAYPGDVFYLHSRLLERSAHLSSELGGGSMTALPIIETMAGDISAYIPTNVISITDGQIFLESELFHSGIRPAVNVGLSVSRVGRSAQQKAMQQVSGTLRIDLAQYHELAIFSQFGSELDKSTKKLLTKGEHLTEMLKQNKQQPFSVAEQVVLLLAYYQNIANSIPLTRMHKFTEDLLAYVKERESSVMLRIDKTGDMSPHEKTQLIQAICSFPREDYLAENEEIMDEDVLCPIVQE